MSKTKTFEHTIASVRCKGSEWTVWHTIDRYGDYEYFVGELYMSKGIVMLYYQPKGQHFPNIYANARIIQNHRVYELTTHCDITRIGWVRIVKKWIKNRF